MEPDSEPAQISISQQHQPWISPLPKQIQCQSCFFDLINTDNKLSYSCNHYLCSNCFIQSLLTQNLEFFSPQSFTSSTLTFPCPCKSGNITFKLKDLVTTLTSINTSSTFDKCPKHEIQLSTYCSDCNIHLCDLCETSHKQLNQQHWITSWSKCNIEEYKSNISFKNYKEFLNNLNEKEKNITEKFNRLIVTNNQQIEEIIKNLETIKSNWTVALYDNIQEIATVFKIIKLLYSHYYKDLSGDTPGSIDYWSKINYEFSDIKYTDPTSFIINDIRNYINKIESWPKINISVITSSWWRPRNEGSKTLNTAIKSKHPFKVDEKIKTECEWTWTGHSWSVLSWAWWHDNKLASGSTDKLIKIWDWADPSKPWYKTLKGHNDSITSIIQWADKKLVSTSKDKTLIIWDVIENGFNKWFTWKGHTNVVSSVIEIPNTEWIISCSFDASIIIWDLTSRKEKTVWNNDNYNTYCLAIVGKERFASSSFTKIKIWNLDNYGLEFELVGHSSCIYSLAMLGVTKWISGGYDKNIILWDLEEKKAEFSFINAHTQAIKDWKVIHNNSWIVSASWDKSIKIWDVGKREEVTTIFGHTNEVLCLCDLGNGKVASGSDDNSIKIWNLNE